MDEAEGFVNHNNQLVQAEDKSYLILTLKELLRGGHGLNLDEICAYTMATVWSGEEVKRIRKYGETLLQGRGSGSARMSGRGRGLAKGGRRRPPPSPPVRDD